MTLTPPETQNGRTETKNRSAPIFGALQFESVIFLPCYWEFCLWNAIGLNGTGVPVILSCASLITFVRTMLVSLP
jgi:hypothetical protein